MNLDDIITLDDNRRYYIVDIVEYENVKYYLAVGLLTNDEVNTQDFNFLTFEKENDEEYISIVDDPKILVSLYAIEASSDILENDPNGEEILKAFADKMANMDIK